MPEIVTFVPPTRLGVVPVPVPPFAMGRTPVTPVVRGSPVALVSVILDGVPRLGVVRLGEVARTALPVPVVAIP